MVVPTSRTFLWRTTPDGRREIGWRLWVLVWVAPVLFVLAGVILVAWEGWRHMTFVPAEGEVVRVYEWEGDGMFGKGSKTYGPVFRYTWTDGAETEASTGMSYTDARFAVGDRMEIRYHPNRKTDVLLPGLVNFAAGLIVMAIGAVLSVVALLGTLRLLRWKRSTKGQTA